jgi:DNA-binding MarR family transcriptional regulator
VDLMPISAWLMIRLGENEHADLHALAAQQGITRERVEEGLAELHAKRLVTATDRANRVLTAEGCEVFGKLNKARRARLSELAAQWPQEQREEIALVLRSLANALVPERRPYGS